MVDPWYTLYKPILLALAFPLFGFIYLFFCLFFHLLFSLLFIRTHIANTIIIKEKWVYFLIFLMYFISIFNFKLSFFPPAFSFLHFIHFLGFSICVLRSFWKFNIQNRIESNNRKRRKKRMEKTIRSSKYKRISIGSQFIYIFIHNRSDSVDICLCTRVYLFSIWMILIFMQVVESIYAKVDCLNFEESKCINKFWTVNTYTHIYVLCHSLAVARVWQIFLLFILYLLSEQYW